MGKVILFQGDSITDAGRSREEVPANIGLGVGYPYLVSANLLYNDAELNWQIFNRGISGNRVVDLYARWKIDALNIKPDILSILIGVNDTWHEKARQNGVEVPRYEMIFRMLLEWTKKELPETKLVLMEPFVFLSEAVDETWLDEIAARRAVVKKLAEEFGAIFIPLQDMFNEALKKNDNTLYWLRDGVHPTAAGHQLIADAWLKATEGIR